MKSHVVGKYPCRVRLEAIELRLNDEAGAGVAMHLVLELPDGSSFPLHDDKYLPLINTIVPDELFQPLVGFVEDKVRDLMSATGLEAPETSSVSDGGLNFVPPASSSSPTYLLEEDD
jgi:hypothetical protein